MSRLLSALTLVAAALAWPASAEQAAPEPSRTLERARWIHQRLHELLDGETPSPAARAMTLRLARAREAQDREDRALRMVRDHLACRQEDRTDAWATGYVVELDLHRRQEPAPPQSNRESFVLAALESSLESTSAGSIQCCLCSGAAGCDDGLFCTGVEACTDSLCAPGTPPSCFDTDACTDDFCNLATDTCDSTPVPPPPPVAMLDVDRAPGSTVADLSWTGVSESVTYNLYRGERIDLVDLACYKPAIDTTFFSDEGEIASTGVHVFLVSAVECGESGLGDDSSGPRPAPAEVCP